MSPFRFSPQAAAAWFPMSGSTLPAPSSAFCCLLRSVNYHFIPLLENMIDRNNQTGFSLYRSHCGVYGVHPGDILSKGTPGYFIVVSYTQPKHLVESNRQTGGVYPSVQEVSRPQTCPTALWPTFQKCHKARHRLSPCGEPCCMKKLILVSITRPGTAGRARLGTPGSELRSGSVICMV